ncbi:MAG: response regulator transcription factor [Bacteroidetes bacterium]|nr:response regulator transcription factor [Bacteroidota bacterium]MBS1740578.1 response regulator transcription factor [Bacteroidota bacterium]
MPTLIAIAEDNAVNRNTFLQKLALLEDYKLIFAAKDGAQCLEYLKGLPPNRLPKVIFMDLEMPNLGGIQTIQIAKALHPEIQFIVLTVFDDEEKIFEAIKAGATGYLLKHEPASVIKESLIDILENQGAPMSPAIARKTLLLLSKKSNYESEEVGEFPEIISHRENEVLQHIILGRDAKRISNELKISVETVRKHIAHIYSKLHVSSKAEVISLAHKNNWLKEL